MEETKKEEEVTGTQVTEEVTSEVTETPVEETKEE